MAPSEVGGDLPAAYSPPIMANLLRAPFAVHLETRLRGLAQDLEATGFSALVLASGSPYFYFRDDQPAPFRANPHFLHFCPLEAPGHLLLLRPGKRPFLAALCPDDYWYEIPKIGDPFWAGGFRIVECASRKRQLAELARRLPRSRVAAIGESGALAEAFGLSDNPASLLTRLDWRRAVKTDYEIGCISDANRVAADGHRAAEAAFRGGGSELDIHRAFVAAVGGIEAELPYPTIVGLNEKGAVLHYEGKRPAVRNGHSLLLDAGAGVRGYASDITRTHAADSADERFRSLIAAMEVAQKAPLRRGPGRSPLGRTPHGGPPGPCRSAPGAADHPLLSPEAAVENGLSQVFFPHGLGHFLGLQVHDVGGHLRDPEGRRVPPPKAHPTLRSTRTLEPGQVLTVEPGIYFIRMLLERWRSGGRSKTAAVHWDRVAALAPYGGVRIEDDVLVTDRAPRNLTREHLPE